jgi:hypothetical protein
MSQEHNDALRQPPSPSERLTGTDVPRSDTAFPSTLIMGICLIFAIILVGITGWKVLLLDQEQEGVRQQRAILERDINAFKQYSGDLPQLEKRHGELTASVAQLDGAQKGLQQAVDSLTQQRQALADESARLGGDNTELASRINAARKELGQVQGELANALPRTDTAKKELAALQGQEAALRTSISDLQKQAATLSADIQGLERLQAHTQDLLTRMTEDQNILEGFRRSVDSMATQLQASLAKADAASNEYTRQTTNVQTATRNLNAEVVAIQTRSQTMENHIATLQQHGVSFSQILTQSGASAQAAQTQIQTLNAENERLAATLEALDRQVQQWTQHSQGSLTKIKEMEENLLPISNFLAGAVQSITAQANMLGTQIGGVQTSVSSVQSAVDSMERHIQTFAATATDLQSGIRLNSGNGEALSELIVKMQQDLNTLSAAVAAFQAQQQDSSANQ